MNTPTDAPQVRCSVSTVLNKGESPSVRSKVRPCNNPDVDQSQRTGRPLQPFVYVLSVEGKPLMPCTPAKANHMLRKGGCRVVKRAPFTIRLNFPCNNIVQSVTLGLDVGYANIGFSALTEKTEFIAGTVKLDGKTKKRLAERSMYRKGRRNRLWYRKPRFNNRTRKEGWLPPSVQRRLDTHVSLVRRLVAILPISQINVETAKFDIQRLENPLIFGETYQRSNLYG